tara:strand:- start:94 stop:501 length:408 start_codon:yes stop_codon:yes gene_type:complete
MNFKNLIWPKLKSKEDATQALRNCQIVSFYLVFSYSINALINFSGTSIWSGTLDDFDKFFLPLWFLSGAILFLWLGFRIRKDKFGLVPLISIWYILEATATMIMSPTPGQIFLRSLFILIAIGCLRASYFNKRFN